MTTTDRRRHTRVDSINLLAYTTFGNDKRIVSQGMGRTLNVSESGILLETHEAIEGSDHVAVTIALEEELVFIRGSLVRSIPGEDGTYATGINFFEMNDNETAALQDYIRTFLALQEAEE
ncbi:MAG: PilZ domain-containing protein [Proteobacteria bacterium]|nr:PilZ domain-containing protein [Pseudomonadota bacterium]